MAFIRKVRTKSGAIGVQVAHKSYGKVTRIHHIGSAHSDEELQVLLALARTHIQGSQIGLFDTQDLSPVLRIGLKYTASTILLSVLKDQYEKLGFTGLDDSDFMHLCIARLVEPTSKIESLRILTDLGVQGVGKNDLYRCLQRANTNQYRESLATHCFSHATMRGISLVLYDVTTLYFEVPQEDDYRKPGLSKERRLEPQIVIGLLVDQNGFPLELQSFEGNKAETKTLLPVIEQFKTKHQLADITVVADAAMLSQTNLETLIQAGYTYVVGSRLNKIPYDIVEYQKQGELQDGQTITSSTNIPGQRIIYQYRTKRADLDRRNIEKQILKAQRIVEGKAPASRAKFIQISSTKRELNHTLIQKARALAGIKGYVTNLQVPDEQAITHYHQLWHVEQSFRMSKTDLKARPIFHRKRDAIEAHLTVVFAALAVGKVIEEVTGLSLRNVIKTLRPIRNGTVVIQGKEYSADAIIPPEAIPLLEKLHSGH